MSDWATANNLILNNSKTQEIIVHLPRIGESIFLNPTLDPDIKRVDKLNILGITVSSNRPDSSKDFGAI